MTIPGFPVGVKVIRLAAFDECLDIGTFVFLNGEIWKAEARSFDRGLLIVEPEDGFHFEYLSHFGNFQPVKDFGSPVIVVCTFAVNDSNELEAIRALSRRPSHVSSEERPT